MHTSLFELFKIGIGPSSSHTVGPMRAAGRFVRELSQPALMSRVARLRVELYGSLALTGLGHGIDRGILLGLEGKEPDQVEPKESNTCLETIRVRKEITLCGHRDIPFSPDDMVFHKNALLPDHSNGMRFTAFDQSGNILLARVYYSVGGGFITEEGKPELCSKHAAAPFPFDSASELLRFGEEHDLPIHQIMLCNEMAWRPLHSIRQGIWEIWKAMQDCAERGLTTEGQLPGGLGVKRRAPGMMRKISERQTGDALEGMDWLNLWAIAVNEENAAGGRVVTAPTNGAAGVVPAVAHYYMRFLSGVEEGLIRFFLTAAAIGVLYKENASISGADVGCQGEVGVACSMAAAGLVSATAGSNSQIEHAAEIAMEHHLGMTCDPIGGLVQIPCIERNAIGAAKAVNAARMARLVDGHKVSLDQVIRTMYQTGRDMQSRYKETALGGLALNVIEC